MKSIQDFISESRVNESMDVQNLYDNFKRFSNIISQGVEECMKEEPDLFKKFIDANVSNNKKEMAATNDEVVDQLQGWLEVVQKADVDLDAQDMCRLILGWAIYYKNK